MYQPEAVVVELVVRSHGNEPTPGTAQRVEDLWGSISPHLQNKPTHSQRLCKVGEITVSTSSWLIPVSVWVLPLLQEPCATEESGSTWCRWWLHPGWCHGWTGWSKPNRGMWLWSTQPGYAHKHTAPRQGGEVDWNLWFPRQKIPKGQQGYKCPNIYISELGSENTLCRGDWGHIMCQAWGNKLTSPWVKTAFWGQRLGFWVQGTLGLT